MIDDADLDRLADYTAGVLDPPERRRVEDLLATDPDWRRAHAALNAADPRLDAAFATLASPALPAEVAARLDAAIAAEAGRAATGTTNVVDLSARRRWRRLAVAATAAVAAGVAVFGGVVVLSNGPSHVATSSNGANVYAPDARSAAGLGAAGPAVRNSGTDYTRQNLSGVLNQNNESVPSRPGPIGPALGTAETGGLDRLAAPDALRQCLAAIVDQHGGVPTVVDYARFEGQPALVVVLEGGGSRRVVAVGAACGAGGADELYSTTQ